jgi:hypothetical protein
MPALLSSGFARIARHPSIVAKASGGGLSALGITVVILLVFPTASEAAKKFFCGGGDVGCLIAVIDEANASGKETVLTLDAGVYSLTTINNTSEDRGPTGLPRITGALSIRGVTADTTVIERAADAPRFRIFDVAPEGRLTLERVTVRNGDVLLGPAAIGGSPVGGAGILAFGHLTVVDSTVSDNSVIAPTPVGDAVHAGGVSLKAGTLILTRSIVTRNVARLGPGGISVYCGGTAVITQSTISENDGVPVGGMVVTNQVLEFSGGDLCTEHRAVAITDSTIAGNLSASRFAAAGGIFVGRDGILAISNSTVAANSLNSPFGGIGGIANHGTLAISNSTIAGNTAEGGASPPFPPRFPLDLSNTSPGSASLHDTIVGRCLGPIDSGGHNLIGDLTSPFTFVPPCSPTLLLSDLVEDPGLGAFTDDGTPGHGHLPLLPGSVAIDRGGRAPKGHGGGSTKELSPKKKEDCPRTDQLGQPRVEACDIGAIEFQPGSGVTE